MGEPGDRRVRIKDLLEVKEVADVLGISPSSVYVYRHRYPDFPAPVRQGGRCLMWHRSDITRWKRSRSKMRS